VERGRTIQESVPRRVALNYGGGTTWLKTAVWCNGRGLLSQLTQQIPNKASSSPHVRVTATRQVFRAVGTSFAQDQALSTRRVVSVPRAAWPSGRKLPLRITAPFAGCIAVPGQSPYG
jgi:hypothetical protein